MIEVSQRTRARSGSGRAEPAVLTFLRSLDWILMLAAAGLVGYGLWVVSGITRFDVPGVQDYFVVRQGIAAAIGAVGLVVAAIVPVDLWRRYWKVVYVMTLGLMVVVFVAAEAVRGSKRWLDLGFIQFQPSELGKVLFVLAIAGFVVDRAGAVTRWRTIFSAIGLGAIPILLVFAQPDLGTALVYSAALFAVLFFAGLRWRQLLALLAVGVIGITAVLWLLPAAGVQVLKPYQAARLTLDPDADPGGITYNLSQSITAVGSGGLTGRGVIGASQTRLDYLPEHATDFAFASLAEQRGFVGCAILLLLYLLVVWRGLRVITGAGDLYGVVAAGGLVVAFLFQVFVNVGMTMGVAPVTGIPLPFVTVGGSSMVANLVLIGVLQSIHARGELGRGVGMKAAGIRRLRGGDEESRPQPFARRSHRARVGPIVVSGVLADQLAKELGAGAAPGAVVVGDEAVARERGSPRPHHRRRPDSRGRRSSCARRRRKASRWSSSSSGRRRTGLLPSFSRRSWSSAVPGEGFPIRAIADRISEATEDSAALAVGSSRDRGRRARGRSSSKP